MVITWTNYQIALRLIRSLSRFIPLANQTDHPLTNRNLSASVCRCSIPCSFLRATLSLPRSHLSPTLTKYSQLSTGRWTFICIQTTTVNKPFFGRQQLQPMPTHGCFAVGSRDFRSRDPRLRYASHTSKTIRLCAADNRTLVVRCVAEAHNGSRYSDTLPLLLLPLLLSILWTNILCNSYVTISNQFYGGMGLPNL